MRSASLITTMVLFQLLSQSCRTSKLDLNALPDELITIGKGGGVAGIETNRERKIHGHQNRIK